MVIIVVTGRPYICVLFGGQSMGTFCPESYHAILPVKVQHNNNGFKSMLTPTKISALWGDDKENKKRTNMFDRKTSCFQLIFRLVDHLKLNLWARKDLVPCRKVSWPNQVFEFMSCPPMECDHVLSQARILKI